VKLINKITTVVMIMIFLMACNNKSQSIMKDIKIEKPVAENLKNVEVQIKGMTCEIGCARLIQSKLYKTEGIKFAKVSFKDSLGNVTYDANMISNADIKNIIQNVAGGDLYKVVNMNEVENFKEFDSK
jgi:Cu+-exporting ATPase